MVLDRHWKRYHAKELPSLYPLRIIDKDGDVKWVELNTVLITRDGKDSTLNFLSNITERKRADQEMVALQDQLHRAQKRKPLERELPRGGETVLVVEDDKDVRHLAAQILSRQGYRVDEKVSFIPEPFSLEALVSKVREALDK